jgi:hypothetical protein
MREERDARDYPETPTALPAVARENFAWAFRWSGLAIVIDGEEAGTPEPRLHP